MSVKFKQGAKVGFNHKDPGFHSIKCPKEGECTGKVVNEGTRDELIQVKVPSPQYKDQTIEVYYFRNSLHLI